MTFFAGAATYWRGVRLGFGHPRLRGLVLAPSAIVAVASVLGAGALYRWLNALVHSWLHVSAGVGGALLTILVFVLSLVALYLSFILASGIVAAPFAGPLAERTSELESGAPLPPQPFSATLREIARGVVHAVVLLFFFLLTLVPLSLLAWLLPLAAPLVLLQTALFVAYDGLDPLASRGGRVTFSAKWRFLRSHLGACLGFGLIGAFLLSLPIVNFFVPPLTAVGGALLYRELQGSPGKSE